MLYLFYRVLLRGGAEAKNTFADTRRRASSMDWHRPRASRRSRNYFGPAVEDAEDDCDIDRSWNKPIPRPPTAPANKPSRTKTGRLSRIFIFFLGTFPLRNSQNEVVLQVSLACPVPISKLLNHAKVLILRQVYRMWRARSANVNKFSLLRNRPSRAFQA
jgi:hypothetical protein